MPLRRKKKIKPLHNEVNAEHSILIQGGKKVLTRFFLTGEKKGLSSLTLKIKLKN